MREQVSFFDNLIITIFEYEIKIEQTKILKEEHLLISQDTQIGKSQARIKEIEILKIEFTLEKMKKEIVDRITEIEMWEKIKEEQKHKNPNLDINNFNSFGKNCPKMLRT